MTPRTVTRRTLPAATASLVVALAVVAAACSDSSDTSSDVTETAVTSTSISVTTTTLPASTTSTSSTTSSTTSTSTTSTTIPAVVGLDMSAEGLGEALFGAGVDGVLDYVKSILGDPTDDSGWVDPVTVGACPGTEVRFVSWSDLHLFFTDESQFATGSRHFAQYRYGPALGPRIAPYGIATDEGIGVDSTVGELRFTYPDGILTPGDDIFPPTFLVEDGLQAFLTGTADEDVVIDWVGGFGCGE